MLWHIGNTTVRTPYRLRQALIALQGTQFNGNLDGKDNENGFALLLRDSDVVEVPRIDNNPEADVSDLGRKWRSALSQLGFITHKVADELLVSAAAGISTLSGRAHEITPNGYRLIQSEPITAQQECFLRSLLAYRIPSIIEKRYGCNPFNPLKFVIDIIFGLQDSQADPSLSFIEFALFVQTASPDDGIENTVEAIIDFRHRRTGHEGQLRAFYRQEYKSAVLRSDPEVAEDKIATKAQTLDDYADLTLRYLKATGLFRSRGHGIIISAAKEEIARQIHQSALAEMNDQSYLVNIWNGATLPTDDTAAAAVVVENLAEQIAARGAEVTPTQPDEDIALRRHLLEEQLLQLEETEYYRNQASQAAEIAAWMQALISGSAQLPNGETVRIPRGEAPAYFEWIIWRAFLAINSLVNQPWEARRFQIDQDFLPVSTAPGSGPDMIFEFQDAILVVEVTLTSSSRQEAAEGEPVRRHVARYAEEQRDNGKPVYGLFIAINIDSNTAHTFRTGDWFLRDDSKINLHIVPLKLEDFQKLFVYGQNKLQDMPAIIKQVLTRCRMEANQEAPVWKRTISNIVEQQVRI